MDAEGYLPFFEEEDIEDFFNSIEIKAI